MNTFSDVIQAFGGPAKFAEAIKANANTARSWLHRDRIPSPWWLRVSRAAQERGLDGIDAVTLASIAEKANDNRPAEAS